MKVEIKATTVVVMSAEEAATMQSIAFRATAANLSGDARVGGRLDKRSVKIAEQFGRNMEIMHRFHAAVADFHIEHNMDQHDDGSV